MVMKLLKPVCKEEVVKVISENTTSLLGSDRLVVLARWLQCHVHCIPSNKPTQVCPKCYRGMSAVIVVLDRRRNQQTRGGSRKWTWREPIQGVLGTEVPQRGQGAEAQSPGRGSGGWSPREADDFWQLKGYLDVTSGILGGAWPSCPSPRNPPVQRTDTDRTLFWCNSTQKNDRWKLEWFPLLVVQSILNSLKDC